MKRGEGRATGQDGKVTIRILYFIQLAKISGKDEEEIVIPDSVTNVETLLSGILGGIQTLFGAILGTAILKILDVVLSGITQRYLLIMGILFLITIMFAPTGAAGALRRLWDWIASRTTGSGASAGSGGDDPFYKDSK